LPAEERAHWDDVAAKDKQRYMVEKASYTGPWQVPWKRAKKDPSAPKRPMSAFLYFSQGRRRKIKDANPKLKNTEVSRMLGEMWRNASEEDRKPHIDNEKEEREKYKVAIADWRKDYEEKLESQRKTQAEQAANWTPSPAYNPDSNDVSNPQVPYGDPNMPYVHPMYMHPPAPYYPPPHHHHYYGKSCIFFSSLASKNIAHILSKLT
jgi:HMG (high mobility group) box